MHTNTYTSLTYLQLFSHNLLWPCGHFFLTVDYKSPQQLFIIGDTQDDHQPPAPFSIQALLTKRLTIS